MNATPIQIETRNQLSDVGGRLNGSCQYDAIYTFV
jgi:hypothetical protein